MKKYTSLIIFLFSISMLHAQYKVRFVVKEKTAILHDSIYLTGTFNNWDSLANNNYLMQLYGENEKSIVLNLKAGTIEYKFTRGNWDKVEKQYDGSEVSNRVVIITKDTILVDSVEAWRDQIIRDKWEMLAQQKSDTIRVGILAGIANAYAFYQEEYNSDSAFFYAEKALQLQQKIMSSEESQSLKKSGNTSRLISLQEILASLLHAMGNYPKSLEIRMENLRLAEKRKDKFMIVTALDNVAHDYYSMKDYRNYLIYERLIDSILNTVNLHNESFQFWHFWCTYNLANGFYKMKLPDSALYYANRIRSDTFIEDYGLRNLLFADIYAEKRDTKSSSYYYWLVIPDASKTNNGQLIAWAQEGLAMLYLKEGRIDSALYFARQSLSYYQNIKQTKQSWGENLNSYIAEIAPLLADLYRANNQMDSSYKYLYLSVTLKDSLFNVDKIRQFQTLTFNETVRRQQLNQQLKDAQQNYETKIKMYGLISIIVGILVLVFILYRNNKQKQKANTILQTQKQEIESTLAELKITQSQLIQSEKMASLGELTAGIAHEIQNPLNFVNNFSDVSNELIDEMKQELAAGSWQSATEIADNIKQNLEKITHHGKRADAIVKGMLLHSRSNTGQKEPTDINALADEYLRLAYHGLRAKDKSFNATMKTDFDPNLGNLKVIPQEFGRVILNLITNAFYAVKEKRKLNIEGYEPVVTVTTKKISGTVEIIVADNGMGIPQKVLDKIFQPFFTTKPSGEGTGLGLSLSYDIVTKGHGGELKVKTKEGEGTEFNIILPQKLTS